MFVLIFITTLMEQIIKLLPPQKDMDSPLMKAIETRRTKRKWKNELLSMQEISDLCWVACGETKPATNRSKNRRTVPSGCNSQLITLYVALDTGVYKYIEPGHILQLVTGLDTRPIIGTQKMMQSAPLGLIYVADFSKRTGIVKANQSEKMFVAGTEAGLMSQNVYLYCSATRLNTVLIALVNRDKLHKEIGLQDYETVVYTQVVGKSTGTY